MPEAKMVERFVLFDVYAWSTPIAGRPDRYDQHAARRGDRIVVSEEEAARGEALGALSSSAVAVEAAQAASAEPPTWSDVQLDGANVDETVVYLSQHPSEAARVLDLEQSRPDRDLKTRKGVVDAAERVAAEYAEALDARADEKAQAEQAQRDAEAAAAAGGAPRIPGPGA